MPVLQSYSDSFVSSVASFHTHSYLDGYPAQPFAWDSGFDVDDQGDAPQCVSEASEKQLLLRQRVDAAGFILSSTSLFQVILETINLCRKTCSLWIIP